MNRVPPGRAYNSDGRQTPPIDFSSDPKPSNNINSSALGVQPGAMPGQQFSNQTNSYTPTNAPRLSLPTSTGAYGPPGTAGTDANGYLGGAGAPTNGTPLMTSGAADPRTNPPLGSQPPGGAPGAGSQATPSLSAGSGNTLPY
jgi:hypothetical protein